MNIYECERLAQEHGFNTVTFLADFPIGTVKCKWLDAYMGLIQIDMDELRDGFVTTSELAQDFPNLHCHNLNYD